MTYKGYAARVEYDDTANIFHGEVMDTVDVITFQSDKATELRKEFERSVDEYLAFCAENNKKPDKPYSGRLVLRMRPETHRVARLDALERGLSLNAYINKLVEASSHRSIVPFDTGKSCRQHRRSV